MIRPPQPAPLIAVAHGSRDSRSATTVRELVNVARELAPSHDIRPSFLDLSEPRVGDVLAELDSRGHRDAVVAPLLLGSAYHARTDLPAIVSEIGAERPGLDVTTTAVLGIDRALEEVAWDRLRESGADPHDPELGIVLTAVGSSHPKANNAVVRLARRWQRRRGGAPVVAAFATTSPSVPEAITRLRAAGARRIAVASWFLAPGLLPDRVEQQAVNTQRDVRIAAPLGSDPRVAGSLLRRYTAAVAHGRRADSTVACARVSA